MAPTVETTEDFLKASLGRTYTFSEAIEMMKILDMLPSGSQHTIHWVDVKTGKRVAIGYTGGSNTPKKKVVKTSPIPSNYYEKYRK